MFAKKALAASLSAEPVFVESVFSTYLYTGNGSTQTITNGIDLAGEGGLVWIKGRNTSAQSATSPNRLFDTLRGADAGLVTNTTAAQGGAGWLSSFDSTGFSLDTNRYEVNGINSTYASWTFRKQEKFFDVVTYTGNGSNRTISHNLGASVGFMMIKRTDATSNWATWHRALAGTQVMNMANPASAATTDTTVWNSTTPTTTVFSVGTSTDTNASGGTYVAYLWAHDAGGFGLSGTENVISCGFYTSTGNDTINLGWEPQFIATRRTNATGDWEVIDTMRGMSYTGLEYLEWNNSDAAQTLGVGYIKPTATGWQDTFWGAGQSVIYIAIRRGPMKVPTSGTSVFSPNAYAGTSSAQTQTTNFPVDLMLNSIRDAGGKYALDRLRGSAASLETQSTAAESSLLNIGFDSNTAVKFNGGQLNSSGFNYIAWNFRRAPGFFDVVCYTGTGVARTINHNLAAVPELMIVKCRSAAIGWLVYSSALGNTGGVRLDLTNANIGPVTWWNSTTPTSSVFSLGSSTGNNSGETFVAYLFATLAGVSKVGSYTGAGTTKQIDCGFTGGARFVLIKRTDSTGDWYVWDSARGIVAGNDPYLLLNSTAAEVTSTDYIDSYSAGFEISSTAPAAINANGGTFIFLAIA
jgi:hypothetical protein